MNTPDDDAKCGDIVIESRGEAGERQITYRGAGASPATASTGDLETLNVVSWS